MGFLSIYEQTVRLDLGKYDDRAVGYWVDFRPDLTVDDMNAATHALGSPKFGGKFRSGDVKSENDVPVEVSLQQDIAAFREELVLRAIVDWNLTGRDDQPLPLDFDAEAERKTGKPSPRRQSIRQLPPFVFNAIHEAVAEAGSKRDTEEQARFRDRAAGGAEER